MRRVLVIACALSILAAGCAATPVTILYTNDLHLRFGRLDSIARLIEAERAGGSPVFLFDGGDAWQDFRRPLAAVWGADEMVAWMNDVGYDGPVTPEPFCAALNELDREDAAETVGAAMDKIWQLGGLA